MPIKRKTSRSGAPSNRKTTRIDAGPFNTMRTQPAPVHLEIPSPEGTVPRPPSSLSSSNASTSSTPPTSCESSDSDSDSSASSTPSPPTSPHLYHVFRNLTGTPEFTGTFPTPSTANRGTLRAFLATNCWHDFHHPAAVLRDNDTLCITAKWPDGRAAGAWVVPQRCGEPAMKEARTGEVWVLRREGEEEEEVYASEAGAVRAVEKLAGRCGVVRGEGIVIAKMGGFGGVREIARAVRRTVRC